MNAVEMDDLLEPQLLDLPEHLFDTSPQLLQHLFSVWLSLPRPAALVKALIDYVDDRNLISVPGRPVYARTVRSNLVSDAISLGVATPLSPNVGSSGNLSTNESNIVASAISLVIGHTHLPNTGSSANASNNERNLALEQKIRTSSSSIPLALAGDIKQEVIPQFYFPLGRPPTSELREECLNRINDLFNCKPYGLNRNDFRTVTKEVCKLPFFLSFALFQKIVVDNSLRVTRDAFIQYWVNGNMLTMDKATQVFNILKQPDRNYLTKADFLQVLRELCAFHPGFTFLKETPESQETYAATVIFRIFYYINRSGNGHITLRELKRGDLIAAMQHAEEEEDINKVLRYFSYEHVIVIYLKFMELDTDNDMFIDKMDLARYNKHALSSRILDRIFSQVPRRFTSIIEGKMSYEDFVYFILAEEDKPSEPSLEYWFKCIDLDGNGILTCDELEYFYKEQIDRMKCINEEEYVPFELMLHRIWDMIAAEGKDSITLRDVKRSKLSGDFFNILFNLNKFLASEGPKWINNDQEYLTGQDHLRENFTEWDWFALRECHNLLMGEEEVASDEVLDSDKKSPAIEGRSEAGLDFFDDKPKSKKKLRASEAPY